MTDFCLNIFYIWGNVVLGIRGLEYFLFFSFVKSGQLRTLFSEIGESCKMAGTSIQRFGSESLHLQGLANERPHPKQQVTNVHCDKGGAKHSAVLDTIRAHRALGSM